MQFVVRERSFIEMIEKRLEKGGRVSQANRYLKEECSRENE